MKSTTIVDGRPTTGAVRVGSLRMVAMTAAPALNRNAMLDTALWKDEV